MRLVFISCQTGYFLYRFVCVQQVLTGKFHPAVKQIAEDGCAEQRFETVSCSSESGEKMPDLSTVTFYGKCSGFGLN